MKKHLQSLFVLIVNDTVYMIYVYCVSTIDTLILIKLQRISFWKSESG